MKEKQQERAKEAAKPDFDMNRINILDEYI
jgi:hypothetical protein